MSLKQATKTQHHAAERHPVGAAMADGTISPQWWADWLGALFIIHSAIDCWLPEPMQRLTQIAYDVHKNGLTPNPSYAALAYAQSITDRQRAEGAAYVFTGAHLMGGAITAKENAYRVPVTHLLWDDRKEVVQQWSPLRDREDLEAYALEAFEVVIQIMDEIKQYGAEQQ